MNRARHTRSERGAALVLVLVIITLLAIVGLLALQSVGIDRESAAAELGATRAMYIAEAGLHWGLQELDLNYAIDPASPDYSVVTGLPVVTADPTWGPSQLVGWHQLHSDVSKPFGGGSFRVVAKPAGAPDSRTLLVRCLAIYGQGDLVSRRLVEVAIAPN